MEVQRKSFRKHYRNVARGFKFIEDNLQELLDISSNKPPGILSTEQLQNMALSAKTQRIGLNDLGVMLKVENKGLKPYVKVESYMDTFVDNITYNMNNIDDIIGQNSTTESTIDPKVDNSLTIEPIDINTKFHTLITIQESLLNKNIKTSPIPYTIRSITKNHKSKFFRLTSFKALLAEVSLSCRKINKYWIRRYRYEKIEMMLIDWLKDKLDNDITVYMKDIVSHAKEIDHTGTFKGGLFWYCKFVEKCSYFINN